MSPFKEPQPRKPSVEKDAKKVIGGNWPPYARLGNEARWQEPGLTDPVAKAQEKLSEKWKPEMTPLMVVPDHSPFELRKAALEAACALYSGTFDLTNFWPNVLSFEEYLRDGAKP